MYAYLDSLFCAMLARDAARSAMLDTVARMVRPR